MKITKSGTTQKPFIFILTLLFIAILPVTFREYSSRAATNPVKIRYNKKTYTNKSKKLTVKFNGKTVSKKAYKALIINKNYMVPYSDVFKTGMKVKSVYKKSKKTLTMSSNGVKLVMTVGKKTAKLNNQKVKLPTAPLSVRYVSKKKTKIMVPVSFVAKSLHFSYKKSANAVEINSPLLITFDNTLTYYTGAQGNIFYNHKLYTLHALPVIKLSGNMYVPAEEVMQNIMKLDYEYNATEKTITIANEDTSRELILTIDSKQAQLNGKAVTLSAAPKIIQNNAAQKSIVCIPVASVLKQLNYNRGWNKGKSYYEIQSKVFFDWSKEVTKEQSQNEGTNYLYKFDSGFSEEAGIGNITFRLTGTQNNFMKALTVNRTNNVIEITLPGSQYLLDKNQFSNFGEIVNKMDIIQKEESVVVSFTCENVADYSYTNQNNTLVFSILYTYDSKDGSVISYSLSIPKPKDVTYADVTNEDLYASKKFVIYIKGNHVDYFKKNPVIINNSKIRNLTITKSGANTAVTVTTASLMGYRIFDMGDSFQVKVGTPKKVYKNILVLDAGHGGHDSGATNKGTKEKNLNFKIIYTLMKKHFSDNAPTTKIYWTRTNDSFITLANRAAFAKSVGADAFISLHMNSASNTSANGTEVYYSVSNNSSQFGGITSGKMATLFKNQLIKDLKTNNRGVKTAGFYVIKHNTVPAILIELAFLSGNSDYSLLTSASFQEKAANSIYAGIVSMFKTYPTGR